ncbi:hypothetical protein [Streptomyces sp. SH5]|uniref:hypothetical protein n=1 Tax=Streptomyces sp. SH5 TaxID=3041765 RepID=UPI002478212A|nr:hypothetical protein [Streptomyces sp. SH5]WGP10849.1 hypothetical protein QFA72_14735 [Streptomyces sp. SH5]
MRNRIALAAALTTGLIALTATAATAAPAQPGTAASGDTRACGDVKLSGALPVPPEGMAVRQDVSIGPDCEPVLGPARLVAKSGPAATARTTRAAAQGDRQVRSWSEMYDCCNIRMTGLYTTSDWSSDGTVVTASSTEATQQWNREPWNAGWSLKSSGTSADCVANCAVSTNVADASFTYKGIFDLTGNVYANTHRSTVALKADGTASCEFEVDLKNTFIGWNWQRGCE